MRPIEPVVVDAAYDLGALERIGGVQRGVIFQGIAEVLARATGVEAAGVAAHLGTLLEPAVAMGIAGPWSETEREPFLAQTRWRPSERPIAAALDRRPTPVFRRTTEVVPRERYLSSRLYNEFQRPRGIGDQASMCLRAPDGGRLFVSIARVGSEAPISAESLEIAQRLAPLIERCWLSAHRRLPEWVRALSARRRVVLELVAEGLDDHQIAREIGVQYHTVRAHLKDLFRVAGVRSRLHLMQVLNGCERPPARKPKRKNSADRGNGAAREPDASA
ncbi:MAG: LuxR family transcriptional regulator [Planctomycetota bacterium]|nr:MAG: LuxR family transcriptional regulator [Planctomycetota bacterium]